MDRSSEAREFDLGQIAERVKTDTNGPSARAARVLSYLRTGNFSDWDVLCFAVEYIASRAPVLEWLTDPARHLVRLLYIAHYVRHEGIEWMDKNSTSVVESGDEKDKK